MRTVGGPRGRVGSNYATFFCPRPSPRCPLGFFIYFFFPSGPAGGGRHLHIDNKSQAAHVQILTKAALLLLFAVPGVGGREVVHSCSRRVGRRAHYQASLPDLERLQWGNGKRADEQLRLDGCFDASPTSSASCELADWFCLLLGFLIVFFFFLITQSAHRALLPPCSLCTQVIKREEKQEGRRRTRRRLTEPGGRSLFWLTR